MTENGGLPGGLDFTVDKDNLYKEEMVTDLKIANIQTLTPIKPDGSVDDSRECVYIGRAQLNSPQGPVPIQAKLEAKSFEEAMELFPKAMEAETQKVVEAFKRMQEQQQKQQQKQDSRIIVPGMNN